MAIMENNELREYTGFVYDFFSRSMGTPISNFLFPKKITTDAAMVTGDLIKQNLGGYLAGFVENERAPMGLPSETWKFAFKPSLLGGQRAFDSQMRLMESPGLSITASPMDDIENKMTQMVMQLILELTVVKNRMALETLYSGKFVSRDINGAELDTFDFKRKAANSFDYDFSVANSSFTKAIKNLFDVLVKEGVDIGNLGILMGAKWQAKLTEDKTIVDDSRGNQFGNMANFAPRFENVEGLYNYGSIKPIGIPAMLKLLTYSPPLQNTTPSGVQPYIPDDTLVMFPLTGSSGVRFSLGFDTIEMGRLVRRNADAILDTYVDVATRSEFIRLICRPFFMFGNVDHTGTITAKNA